MTRVSVRRLAILLPTVVTSPVLTAGTILLNMVLELVNLCVRTLGLVRTPVLMRLIMIIIETNFLLFRTC